MDVRPHVPELQLSARRLLAERETTPCIVTTPGGQFVIEDTYWTEDDDADAVT
jgi:hypothetical protein